MSILKRLMVGLVACFGAGCGARTFHEQRLLDPCITDGKRLTVYASLEHGTRETRGSHFNPNGTKTVESVTQGDLYEVEFDLRGDAATLTGIRHLLRVAGRPLASAISTTEKSLSQVPLTPVDSTETLVRAPSGDRCCVRSRDRFVVYADAARTTELDSGTVPALGILRFTAGGERLYVISSDSEGRVSRISTSSVGSRGTWDEIRYDAAQTPLDAHPGATSVEGFDVLDGEPVLLLRKYYAPGNSSPSPRPQSFAILRGGRVVAIWTAETAGLIRPDIRAVVGWYRSGGSLQATFALRSLDDGSSRTWQIDARPVLDQPRR